MTHILYTTFINQPTICRLVLYLNKNVKNGQCTDEVMTRSMICYYDPLSELSVENVDWTQLLDFLNNETSSTQLEEKVDIILMLDY